ncbi:MAG: prepilin-type N-terminal cleavage/methylation domain-containing protein [Bacilli bacterium]
MKKLNRKGFTLIELLAVIVVLAIVLVVTIPSVISSMNSARQKSLDNVVATIEEYVTKQYELCKVGTELMGTDTTTYQTTWFDANCALTADASSDAIIVAAGYTTTDIPSITGSITNNKYVITNVNSGNAMTAGQFKGAKYPA